MHESFLCFASAAFGLEGLVAEELRSMNMKNVQAENGGVLFSASQEEIFLCNLKTHFCDRIYLLAAEDKCLSFEHLFQLVSSFEWEEIMQGNEAINVTAKCARSKLMSPRDCQSISKKAIISRLQQKTGRQHFPENGPSFPVHIAVHSDRTRILINTSGDSLSRRGYRTWNGIAPIRETLASALIHLSPWKPGMPLYDPCCGTGTILIEAALLAARRAPGISRHFSMESFSCFRSSFFDEIRRNTMLEEVPAAGSPVICGSDIDPNAIELALRHVKQADCTNKVSLSVLPLQSVILSEPNGVFICNPPYGERISDQKTCHLIYKDLRALKDRHPGWSFCAISSDPSFERYFGKKADRKRRLYNGRLECTYYIYY